MGSGTPSGLLVRWGVRLMSAILDVRALERFFDVRESRFGRTRRVVRAVDGVDLAVRERESMGVCGESGCGKTTLAYLIVGLLVPTSGTIHFRSRPTGAAGGAERTSDLTAASRREWRGLRREIQIVFQNSEASLNPRRTVGASIADPLLIHRMASRRVSRVRVGELLSAVGLESNVARRFPSALSAGQRQRVGIARALAPGPRLLVCDEPVSSLDSSVQAEILGLLADLRVGRGLTILLIAHNLLVLRNMTDRIAVMQRGRFVEQATTDELFLRPRHPYTEKLLFSSPRMDEARGSAESGIAPSGVDSRQVNGEGCRYRVACRYAQAECEREDPRPREVTPDHVVACRRADELTLSSPLP